jgi:tripartite-type tricarboxylate transporter receptor subunit TctC
MFAAKSAKEAGINYQMSIWAGVFAPKGTPKEIVAKLATALDNALDDHSARKRLADLGGSIPAKQERTPASFTRLVKAEIARWSPMLKAANLTTH